MIKVILCSLLVLTGLEMSAQKTQHRAEKWGQISPEDLKMTIYPEDSTAPAVVLQDVGSVNVTADEDKWIIEFYRHRRLKILDLSALDKGSLLIQSWNSQLRDLNVQVFLPNGEKQKVKSDNIFSEKRGKKTYLTKIFIPNLQKGSIIEYRYFLKEDFGLFLHPWFFQEELPVRWSQLNLSIPYFFDFVYLLHSPHAFDLEESSQERAFGFGGSRYTLNLTSFGLANLPAIKEEPRITTLDDYRAQIGFQMKSYTHWNGKREDIITTWKDLAHKLEDEDALGDLFGSQYIKTGNFKSIWEAFSKEIKASDTPDEMLDKALHFVTNHVKWNGEYTLQPTGKLDEIFQKNAGGSADVNLMVVALLRKAGLKSYPMLISTRENGRPYPLYPFIDQFNSVIAYVRIGASGFPVDATSPLHPPGELDNQHYNGKGWVVDPDSAAWVDIKAPDYSETWFGKLQLSDKGELSGSFDMVVSGPAAFALRADLEQQSMPAILKKQFASNISDVLTDSIIVTNQRDLKTPLAVRFNCMIQGAATVANDFMYVQPVLDFSVLDNPFKSLNRIYPVDFTYPLKSQYVLNLQIPPGYNVEELPPAAKASLPDNAGRFTFSCTRQSEHMIQLVLRMNLSKTQFLPEEYGRLRQFFDLLVEKTKIQLILKKT